MDRDIASLTGNSASDNSELFFPFRADHLEAAGGHALRLASP